MNAPASYVVVVRCPMAAHPQHGTPKVPVALKAPPNLNDEKQRHDLISSFLQGYAELQRTVGGQPLPTGVDPDWELKPVEPEDEERRFGAQLVVDLVRDTPVIAADPGQAEAHRLRALAGIPLGAGEVPMVASRPQAMPPGTPAVLPPGMVPPGPPVAPQPPQEPVAQGQPPSTPPQSSGTTDAAGPGGPPLAAPGEPPAGAGVSETFPQPDIQRAPCGGLKCAIVNGVEAHDASTCPSAG